MKKLTALMTIILIALILIGCETPKVEKMYAKATPTDEEIESADESEETDIEESEPVTTPAPQQDPIIVETIPIGSPILEPAIDVSFFDDIDTPQFDLPDIDYTLPVDDNSVYLFFNNTVYKDEVPIMTDCYKLSDNYYYKDGYIYDIVSGSTVMATQYDIAYFDGAQLYSAKNSYTVDGYPCIDLYCNDLKIDSNIRTGTVESIHNRVITTTQGGYYDIKGELNNIKRVCPNAILYNVANLTCEVYYEEKTYFISGTTNYYSGGYDYFVYDSTLYSSNGCEVDLSDDILISKDNCNSLYQFYAPQLGQKWSATNIMQFLKIDDTYFYFMQYQCGHIIKLNKKTGAYSSLKKLYTPKNGDISEAKKYKAALQMQVVGSRVYWYDGCVKSILL